MNTAISSIETRRPVPRVGDNLDRLLDLLDLARAEQEARAKQAERLEAYHKLIEKIKTA